MELFATDRDKLAFLAQAEAEMKLSTLGLYEEEPDDSTNYSEAAKQPKEEPAEEPRPKYITNYIGSKQKLIDWIWANTPEKTESVLDAFSGSAVVGYMYKSKGLAVQANDRLHYSHHAAKAIIENSSTKLSEADIEELLAANGKSGSFVQDNFKGIFFAKGVHALIDTLRANCDKFSGYKKDIALFALGKTCMSGKGGFGHFSSSTGYGKRQDTPEEFKTRFKDNLNRINALVFDNGKQNKAYNEDVNNLLPKVKADLAYFDPPYATEFSTTNYEKSYHFVEGLMTYWEGLKLKTDTKVKYFETDHETVTKANANNFFQVFLKNAAHISHWLISYRDHAYPNEQEMKKIIGSLGRQTRMKSKDHHYSITAKHGEASNAKEHIIICQKNSSAQAAKAINLPTVAANLHLALPVELGLSSQALDLSSGEDPQFSFILCRTGTNRNGDHFTAEELAGRHLTVINKKVDLQHSQEFADIVGGIIAADYVEDENGGRVECVGELYIRESQQAQLAYKLIKRGVITQVSMECDYTEGECSICGKRFQNKADYCAHLRKFKGRDLEGKPVFEILHGVTFTGLGLLDRKGADENARILQIASIENQSATQNNGEEIMDEKLRRSEEQSAAAAKKKQQDEDQQPGNESDLEKENKQLKAQIAELQKRIEELEAEQKAAACRSRAKKLLTKLEKQGLNFSSEEEKESELQRLAGLSDDAFAATEKAYEQLTRTKKPESELQTVEKQEAAKAQAAAEQNLRSSAGIRPHDVDDAKVSLEDRLRNGFMAAYLNRVGEETAETLNID